MEKMNFEQPETGQIKKEGFSFKEKIGKTLRAAGIPIAFSAFLASCGGNEAAPLSSEALQNAKEKGAVIVPLSTTSDIEAIIQKAKDEKKTVFFFDDMGGSERISVDTLEGVVTKTNMIDYDTEKRQTEDRIGIDATTVSYASFVGALQQDVLVADRQTGVVRKAVVDEGVYDAVYGITEKGEVVGDVETGQKAASKVDQTVIDIKQKLGIQ